ncbi:MAG: NADH-quinone oxidoreductase subunit A [Bacteroidetes bacterium]|nr:NADH-quinone oxidoreductase subunit A [Rhodothermia bacterium]MCS7155238.1 NADH-quinone oxidoreductase subunit A [Bacteroidota bacterium]MCX7907823.1 NADH-quinone oxidoreductase subunit A [Bacteroidota bacterium]MDW8138642.1 NADH-quinone oxidoreductase subunit A [Bacteroidota bacterium]MDW8284772.1 NADH-quinone oxidoreductase subunit A [Bacteroidota bacterium]
MLEAYLPLLLLLLLAIGVAVFLAALSENLGIRKPNPRKLIPYESGMDPVGTTRERYSVHFYLIAMLFIVFDVEVVLLYPWAVQLRELGWPVFGAVMIFLLVVMIGDWYCYKKGVFDWDKEARERQSTEAARQQRQQAPQPQEDTLAA